MYKYTSICIALCAIIGGIISSSLAQDTSPTSVVPGISTTSSAVDPCGVLSNTSCESCVSSPSTPCSYVLPNEVPNSAKWTCKTVADLGILYKLILNNTEDCSKFNVSSSTTNPPDTTTNPTTTTISTTITSTATPETTTSAPETTSVTSTTPTTSPTTPPTSTTTAPPTPIPTNATTLPPPPITTVVPISTTSGTTTTAAPHTDERHFDAASFFGGFVLLLGLMSIAFLGLKFYRARTGRNYHTLEI